MGLYCSRRVTGLGPWSLDRDIQGEGASTSKCMADAPLQYMLLRKATLKNTERSIIGPINIVSLKQNSWVKLRFY